MNIIVRNGEIFEIEKRAYANYMQKQYPNERIETLEITLDGDEVDLNVTFATVAFQRIRRITGYLVDTIDRFNDAKRSEVNDRVKHGMRGTE